eukprot:11158725-Lingulodinium_polyedra.AAC.1
MAARRAAISQTTSGPASWARHPRPLPRSGVMRPRRTSCVAPRSFWRTRRRRLSASSTIG